MAGSSRPGSILGLRRLFRTKHVAGDVFDVQPMARRTTLESYVTQEAHSSCSGSESPPAPCRQPLRVVVPSNRVLNRIPIGNRDRNRDRECLGGSSLPFMDLRLRHAETELDGYLTGPTFPT